MIQPSSMWLSRSAQVSLLLVSLISVPSARATIAFEASAPASRVSAPSLLEWAAKIGRNELLGPNGQGGQVVASAEYPALSGIGAIVCSAGGERRSATAFLVGRFDIAVSVAHAFEFRHRAAQPADCFYTNADLAGRIRERIPVAEIQTQWRAQPKTFGRAASDLAVVRLSEPVKLAQRTMSFTKFTHLRAPVALVGFGHDLAADALKRKFLGHVYPRPAQSCVRFAHDVDSRGISSGAPLIDTRDGVVIGIHTRLRGPPARMQSDCRARGNAMLLMNEWLQQTLRAEISTIPAPLVNSSASHSQRAP